MLNEVISNFVTELFDYAGLFPPAKLNLADALHDYAQYQTHPQSNMLGKFILPVAKIDEVILFVQKNQNYFSNFTHQCVSFSILPTKINSSEEIRNVLKEDIEKLKKIIFLFPQHFSIKSLEFVAPADVLQDKNKSLEYLETLSDLLLDFDKNINIYIEAPFLHENPSQFIEAIASYNSKIKNSEKLVSQQKPIGLKLRTGGLAPEQIPSPDSLGQVIIAAVLAQLPIKLTAGLHQPFPNFNSAVGAQMHGYINVLSAILLCGEKQNNIENSLISRVLQEKNPHYFKFTGEGYKIGEIFIEKDKLRKIKEKYMKGIGSCDFIEPVELFLKFISDNNAVL